MTQTGILCGLLIISCISGCTQNPPASTDSPKTSKKEILTKTTHPSFDELYPKHSPDFTANHEPLSAAIARLAALTETHINFNMEAIKASGISLEMPISVEVKNARISSVLKALLKQVKNRELGFTMYSPEEILITTRSDLYANHVYQRQYNVRDLLPDWNDPDQAAVGSRLLAPADRAASLVQLFKETVDPISWETRGNRCRIEIKAGVMTVVQTFENLKEFEDLLGQVRETRTSASDRPVNYLDFKCRA